MSRVLATAEELLDFLDLSLEFVLQKVTACNPTKLHFSLPIEARQNLVRRPSVVSATVRAVDCAHLSAQFLLSPAGITLALSFDDFSK
jgi:hypothetical protein